MNSSMDNPRVAIYARVSTQEQANEGTSLEHQNEQLIKYCEAQGWEVVNQYVDPGHTGKNDDRPGLKRLMADAKLGMFSKVVVYKLDRLSRNLRLLLELEEKLKHSDVGLHSVKEAIDTSKAIGRTVFQVLGLVGEWEREAIIERTTSGRLQRYREGKWAGGKPVYGYSYDRQTKKLTISESEARIVRRIFKQYNSGKSLAKTADTLNEDRIQARGSNGKGWRATSVRNVLLNPAYKGLLIVNRHEHIANIGKVDMSKAITIKVPAIVTEDVWQIAQRHLVDNKMVRLVRDNKWLLQGLVTCGLCGSSFKAEGHPNLRYYSCRGRLKQHHLDGSPRCTAPRHKADWLEDQVWQRVETIINDPNKLESLLKETIESLRGREEDLRARVMPIEEQLSEISEQKARLADDWVTQHMGVSRFKELQQNLDKEEARLRSIRSNIDPAQIEELEHTQSMLRFWDSQLQSMAWNLETEDGQMVRTVDKPHQMILKILGLDNVDMTEVLQFPSTKRELLDKLQVRVVVFLDRAEVNAVFHIDPIVYQKCTSTCQGEGDKGDRVTNNSLITCCTPGLMLQ